jgi:glycosyltransferase involved in cell wall biosynthesis
MKILKVIHGYPHRYSAGSEVYSQTLCHELVNQGCEVVVLTRQENAYKQEYSVEWERDPACPEIHLCLINMAHGKDGYRHSAIDRTFGDILDQYQPDVIHVGHLNHLSTSMIFEAHRRNFPIVFTLHDFWLMCPRGQFLQGINSKGENLYPICESQENEKCAKKCYWRYFSSQEDQEDIRYWTDWVKKRMDHVREIVSYVDLYIAPSHYLRNRFIDEFHIPRSKIHYLDYGFQRDQLAGRKRIPEKAFTFGYIGTHKQAKGIFHLIQAFSQIEGDAVLKIWGAPVQPFTHSLQDYVSTLGSKVKSRIFWEGSYQNEAIVSDVFNHVDAIVVPSIWGENSPLVIHEALQAQVPVITADYGGMKEYIQDQINGLLFEHRNPSHLAIQMRRLIDDPKLGYTLSQKGYLQSEDGQIPSIQEHTRGVISLYHLAIQTRIYGREKRALAHHV